MVDVVVWSTLYPVLAAEAEHSASELEGVGRASAYQSEGHFLAVCMHVCVARRLVGWTDIISSTQTSLRGCMWYIHMLCTIRPTIQSHPLCETVKPMWSTTHPTHTPRHHTSNYSQ